MHALRGLTLDVDAGELTCLAGPSGSGKSTLLSLLGLIEPVQEGSLRFAGRDLARIDEKEKNHLRRFELGFVFQQFLLFEALDAAENVAYFLRHRPLTRSERDREVDAALDAVGLAAHRRKRPLEMSGGQRQRVAIARALVKKPSVLIADEPTASLDQATGRGVMEIFRRLAVDERKTVVMASHDPMAIGYATRLVRLRDGQLESDGAEGPARVTPLVKPKKAEGPHAPV